MPTRCCTVLLALTVALAVAPALAQEPAPPAQAKAGESGADAGRTRRQPLTALLLLLIPAVGGSVVVARTGLSVTVAAVWPGFTDRAGRWVRERPALCFANGLLMGLVIFLLVAALGQAGEGGQLAAVLLLILAMVLTALGSVGVCEVVGQRIYELLPEAEPSRLARLIVGTVALVLALLTPPGWPFIPVVLACSLGACRLGLSPPTRPATLPSEV